MLIVDDLGRWTLARGRLMREMLDLLYAAIKSLVLERGRGLRLVRTTMRKQILFTGLQAIPLITIVSITVGVWLALMLYAQSGLAVGEFYVPLVMGLLNSLNTSTLLPMLVALILIARSGTAISTELGNMTINREIDVLQSMGINIDYYVVLPRLLSMVVSFVCLTMYAATFTVLTELATLWIMDIRMPFQSVATITLGAGMGVMTLIQAAVKSAVIALGIGVIACYFGLATGRSFTEVPKSATAGVVNSIFFAFIVNALLSALFFLV